MRSNLNRRKFVFLNKKNIFYLFFLITLIIITSTIYFKKVIFSEYFYNTIENFSEKFNYQFINLNLSGLDKVEHTFIEAKLQKNIKSSIFLLPLSKINDEIRENNWIKSVQLSTNYKDTLYIKIREYEPFGIYNYNNKNFFFDYNGKIIDEIVNNKNNNLDLIIFSGQSSNLKAPTIISVLKSLNFQKKYEIKKINYIKKRRWNILLNNNTNLILSENSPKESLEIFIKIEENLSETEMNNIKSIDLRNINRALLEYY